VTFVAKRVKEVVNCDLKYVGTKCHNDDTSIFKKKCAATCKITNKEMICPEKGCNRSS
jgi:hypothetical protein